MSLYLYIKNNDSEKDLYHISCNVSKIIDILGPYFTIYDNERNFVKFGYVTNNDEVLKSTRDDNITPILFPIGNSIEWKYKDSQGRPTQIWIGLKFPIKANSYIYLEVEPSNFDNSVGGKEVFFFYDDFTSNLSSLGSQWYLNYIGNCLVRDQFLLMYGDWDFKGLFSSNKFSIRQPFEINYKCRQYGGYTSRLFIGISKDYNKSSCLYGDNYCGIFYGYPGITSYNSISFYSSYDKINIYDSVIKENFISSDWIKGKMIFNTNGNVHIIDDNNDKIILNKNYDYDNAHVMIASDTDGRFLPNDGTIFNYYMKIVINKECVNSSLENFPLFLKISQSSGLNGYDCSHFFSELEYSLNDDFNYVNNTQPSDKKWRSLGNSMPYVYDNCLVLKTTDSFQESYVEHTANFYFDSYNRMEVYFDMDINTLLDNNNWGFCVDLFDRNDTLYAGGISKQYYDSRQGFSYQTRYDIQTGTDSNGLYANIANISYWGGRCLIQDDEYGQQYISCTRNTMTNLRMKVVFYTLSDNSVYCKAYFQDNNLWKQIGSGNVNIETQTPEHGYCIYNSNGGNVPCFGFRFRLYTLGSIEQEIKVRISNFSINTTAKYLFFNHPNALKISLINENNMTELPVEVSLFDQVNKVAYLFTNVSKISNTEDTVLKLYYDKGHNDNIAYVGYSGSNPCKNVWFEYQSVFHFHVYEYYSREFMNSYQYGSNERRVIKDSSKYGFNYDYNASRKITLSDLCGSLLNKKMNTDLKILPPYAVINNNGASNSDASYQGLMDTYDTNNTMFAVNDKLTLEVIISPTFFSTNGVGKSVILRKSKYTFFNYTENDHIYALAMTKLANGVYEFPTFYIKSANILYSLTSVTHRLNLNDYNYIACTYDSNLIDKNMKMYINGSFNCSKNKNGNITDEGGYLHIGGGSMNTSACGDIFNMQEVRICDKARSEDWINFTYINMQDRVANFYSQLVDNDVNGQLDYVYVKDNVETLPDIKLTNFDRVRKFINDVQFMMLRKSIDIVDVDIFEYIKIYCLENNSYLRFAISFNNGDDWVIYDKNNTNLWEIIDINTQLIFVDNMNNVDLSKTKGMTSLDFNNISSYDYEYGVKLFGNTGLQIICASKIDNSDNSEMSFLDLSNINTWGGNISNVEVVNDIIKLKGPNYSLSSDNILISNDDTRMKIYNRNDMFKSINKMVISDIVEYGITSVRYLFSFDGRQTWKRWNGSGFTTTIIDNILVDGNNSNDINNSINNITWDSELIWNNNISYIDIAICLRTLNANKTPCVNYIYVDAIYNYAKNKSYILKANTSFICKNSQNTIKRESLIFKLIPTDNSIIYPGQNVCIAPEEVLK